MMLDRANPQEGQKFAEALGRETRSSMIAVSAAAHAIDAFYGATKRYIPIPKATLDAWLAGRTRRRSQILETLKLGFTLRSKGNSWCIEFSWLFDARDAAVHFEEQAQDFVPHPTGTSTTKEHVTYSLESAKRSVDLLLDVLSTCQQNPKRRHAELAAYVSAFGDSIEQRAKVAGDSEHS